LPKTPILAFPLAKGEGIRLLPLKKREIKRGWFRIHQVQMDKRPSGEPVDFTPLGRCDIPRGEFSGEEDGSNGN
jgi:hypothetical protein